MSKGVITISDKTRLRAALGIAIIADLVQVAVFPMFIEGAASPVDDILDVAVASALSFLLGWNWEFLPSFLAKLVPGVDFIPLWTMAVGNVYRKRRRGGTIAERDIAEGHVIEGEPARRT